MCRLFLMTVALLAILFGITGLYMMPKLIQQKIEQKIQLKIGTQTYARFTKVPLPLTVKFNLFNITNSDQVLAGLERPQFQEVGPFVYKQFRRREVVDIIDNNRKIVYREYKTFYSQWPAHDRQSRYLDLHSTAAAPTQQIDINNNSRNNNNNNNNNGTAPNSGRMLNPNLHNVTMINLPLLLVLNQLAQLEEGSFKRTVAARVVGRLIREGREKILVTKPANELLFDGYKVGLMEAASDLISNTLGYNFESPLPKNKFGFFHNKNGTWSRFEAGELTIFTGRNDSMSDFMQVDTWNGLTKLDVWPKGTEAGNRCNEIRGTDGSQFHPGVTRDQTLDIFSPLVCTSIYIKYKEDTMTRGVPLLRFTTPPDVFAAPKKSARNACYCTIKSDRGSTSTSTNNNNNNNNHHHHHHHHHSANISMPRNAHKSRITDSRCYIDGLMDLSLCQRGAPVAASSPHFYNADPMLAMASGLKPQKHLHETYIDVEPMTGVVMRAASRAQLNALVEQAALEVVDPQLIGNMAAMVAPLLWLEEAGEIDEKFALEFKGQLLLTVQKVRRSFFYAIAFGCLLALVVGLQYWYVTCYKIDTTSSSGKARKKHELRMMMADEEAKQARARRHRSAERKAGSTRARNLQLAAAAAANSQPDHKNSASASAGAAVVVGAVAAALGAADAAATANQRRQRDRERHRTRRADYEADVDADDDDLSKRGLVENEWGLGAALNQSSENSTSGDHMLRASPVASTSGGDHHLEAGQSHDNDHEHEHSHSPAPDLSQDDSD